MLHGSSARHLLYYEAILQLRDVSPGVINAVKNEISKSSIRLVQLKKVKNGYDYYLADSKFTKALGKRLQQHFGGELLITASLFTHKEGRNIYRITVLFRQAEFKKGDKVFYRGEQYLVYAVGKHIFLQQEGKKTVKLRYREMKSVRKV